MDASRWIVLLRWPLEIGSLGLAFVPLLNVSLVWGSLPAQVALYFGATIRPRRWWSRSQVWIMPVLALIVYGFMSKASGTWAWVFRVTNDLPVDAGIPLLLKPVFAMLAIHANYMLLRIARKPRESLNGWMLWGLLLLLLTPPIALALASRY
jgi:hypothetical protein